METLIIVLIVAVIAQTCVFIYANFIDVNNKRERASALELMTNQHADFLREKENFLKILRAKDEIIKQWIDKVNKLDFELDETRKVNGLLKSRTAYIEGLEDSFNQQAEAVWGIRRQITNIEHLAPRIQFVEGMKAGAEWLAECVGVKVVFEIDDRHIEEQ